MIDLYDLPPAIDAAAELATVAGLAWLPGWALWCAVRMIGGEK